MTDDDETLVVEGRGDQTRFVDAGMAGKPRGDTSKVHSKQRFSLDTERGSGSCYNVLLRLGADLLALLALMPRLGRPGDIDRLRDQVQEQLVQIRNEGGFLACHPWALEKSGLVLCAALDEAVLKTSWGRDTGWANNTLLSRIYGRRNGGELFYQLMDQARLQPELLSEFLELQYVLLRLGFSGRYHDQPGQQQSAGYELFRLIQRVSPGRPLECPQMPSIRERSQLWRFRYGRIALFTGAVILIMLLVAGGRYARLVEVEKNMIQTLSSQHFQQPVQPESSQQTQPAGTRQ